MEPKSKAKYDEKAQQALSDKAGTDPAQMKENVAKSKAQPRERMPNVRNMTKEQRAELLKQLQEVSKNP
jgi:hypothetical protein